MRERRVERKEAQEPMALVEASSRDRQGSQAVASSYRELEGSRPWDGEGVSCLSALHQETARLYYSNDGI